MSLTCKIQWVDCGGKPTPDQNDAVGYAVLKADGRRFPICREHLDVMRRARCHSGDCSHVTSFPNTWDFEPLQEGKLCRNSSKPSRDSSTTRARCP